MSVRMRHTKGHTGNRRSHHALTGPRLAKCPSCEAMHVLHTVCGQCGNYRGRKVIDMEAKIEKKMARQKRKLKEMGEDPSKATEEK